MRFVRGCLIGFAIVLAFWAVVAIGVSIVRSQ